MARTGSVEKEYNQAGEVVTELSNGGVGYGTETQTFSYDARGEQTGKNGVRFTSDTQIKGAEEIN